MRSSAQPPHFSARNLQRLDIEEAASPPPRPARPPVQASAPAAASPSPAAAPPVVTRPVPAAPYRAAPPFGRAFADQIPGAVAPSAPVPAVEPTAFEAPLPSWLQPFAFGLNARFTRTPDYLMGGRAAEAGEYDGVAESESAVPGSAVPVGDGDDFDADDFDTGDIVLADADDGRAGLAAFMDADEASGAADGTEAPAPDAVDLDREDVATWLPAEPAASVPDPAAVPHPAEAREVPDAPELDAAPLDTAEEAVAAAAADDARLAQPETIRRLAGLIVVDRPALAGAAEEQDNGWVPALDVATAAVPADEDDGWADRASDDPAIWADGWEAEATAESEIPADGGPDEAPVEAVPVEAQCVTEAEADVPAPEAVPIASAGAASAAATVPMFGSQWTVAADGIAAQFAWPITAAPVVEATPSAAAAVDAGVGEAANAPRLPPEPPAPTHAPFTYALPPLDLLAEPPAAEPCFELSEEFLEKSSVFLQQTLHDFGVRGEIIDANPGPVVTLYELEPAPGTKSSRVISLSGDISRSMSAVSARVAVVEGRNVIGIELPNPRRETVWLRELLSSPDFAASKAKLGLCLGKTIGGEPVIADLARMPHLLVAGTTGSGKSVAINTMILSLLYRHTPEDCRLIMIDPKMLELSVYEGIPHLLTPVVTDPRKAVVALKWAVREMEDRYRKMSRLGVRNIDGFNARVAEAAASGETVIGSDGEPMELTKLPYIVVIVDEMADLMMVAGKDIEGAIQRLAQMARAAGIHIVMATQRPSVDVITGTIKANFPTRISFQVTSKIDSRTILGEQGAEQLLGQGDMLYMAGGGRIQRVHGPFVSDGEVENVVAHLKAQGRPEYLDAVVASDELAVTTPQASAGGAEAGEEEGYYDDAGYGDEGADLYDQAVTLVFRDRKASTSYVQRRLKVGYNRAASIMERMENEGIVGPANHAGKREIIGSPRGGHHGFD